MRVKVARWILRTFAARPEHEMKGLAELLLRLILSSELVDPRSETIG